jgi:hypothetical protein
VKGVAWRRGRFRARSRWKPLARDLGCLYSFEDTASLSMGDRSALHPGLSARPFRSRGFLTYDQHRNLHTNIIGLVEDEIRTLGIG